MDQSAAIVMPVIGSARQVGSGGSAFVNRAAQVPFIAVIDLGKARIEWHEFRPDTLAFEIGALEDLMLHRPGNGIARCDALRMRRQGQARKVQVGEDISPAADKLANHIGTIREIEIDLGGITEWLLPVVAGMIADRRRHIKARREDTHARRA